MRNFKLMQVLKRYNFRRPNSLCIRAYSSGQQDQGKKDTFFSEGNLDFSQDTVIFDTVFTSVGSTTQRLKIYNRSNQNLRVDEIELMGGENSPFRINVDGISGIQYSNLEIEGNDDDEDEDESTMEKTSTRYGAVIKTSTRQV